MHLKQPWKALLAGPIPLPQQPESLSKDDVFRPQCVTWQPVDITGIPAGLEAPHG